MCTSGRKETRIRRQHTHLFAVRPLDDELVLEHDEVPLALLELHEVLHTRTERVEQVAVARLHFLRREQAEPLLKTIMPYSPLPNTGDQMNCSVGMVMGAPR